jgi:hypothetical protein
MNSQKRIVPPGPVQRLVRCLGSETGRRRGVMPQGFTDYLLSLSSLTMASPMPRPTFM